MQQDNYLRTGKLCELGGIERETLRFYEAEGLIPPPRRSLNGYREYPADTLLRLQFIRHGKQAGFTLAEIAQLLNQPAGADPQMLRAALVMQIERLESRIGELQSMRQLLLDLLQRPLPADDSNCPIVRLLQGKKEST